MRVSLNYWILLWFSAIYFWYYFDSASFYCWSFLISIFKFFYFSSSLLIWSWLSSSWVMKVRNLFVELFFMNSMSSSSFTINILLSLLTFKESLSRSGFYLKSLHNFFVLSLRMMERLAISASTSSSYLFWVIWVRLALLRTNSAKRRSFCSWFLRSLLISKPASSLLMSSWYLTESRNLKLVSDSSIMVRNLKLSMKFINI